ncbi:hypothetical protein LTV02_26845 [Nocardia yamanashiensis]|uniref:DUF7373 family lipoprotein n=1 Tax=Nocardia yamanashiensis TaxID=209247 RepID=UPI001E5448DC|nr:hypothetical protein [Nocardia yamanashiensis]UGT39660.1 hypothetical protein LTV02_26845 [Nocardia yamanashiensis]
MLGLNRLWPARFGQRAALALVLVITGLTSVGCGSESEAVNSTSDSIDLSKLDVGPYSAGPTDVVPKDRAAMGRNLEALRLARVMPLPQEIDPALTYYAGDVAPFTRAEDFDGGAVLELLDGERFAENTSGFVSGFHIRGQSSDDKSIAYNISAAAMLFETDEAASVAAPALARTGFTRNFKYGEGTEPAQSLQYPTAAVIWTPKMQTLASWYATGRFVIVAVALNRENVQLNVSDQAGLVALADHTTSVIAERLKNFQPTPMDKLSELPVDPEGMLRLTLSRPTGDRTGYAVTGRLDSKTALQRSTDLARIRELYERTGVDYISYGAGELVRTRDAAAAGVYMKEISASRFLHRIEPPPGLPVALCEKYRGPRSRAFPYHCYVTHGRYAAEIWSQQQQDAYQRISAQYAILANDK